MPGRADRQEAVLRALGDGGCLTVEELASMLGLWRSAAAQAAGRLIIRGYVERVERGCYRATAGGLAALAAGERLTSGPRGPESKPRRPRRHTDGVLFWRAIRILKKFSAPQLLELAACDDHIPDPSAARRYVARLADAGYVVRLPARGSSRAPYRYLLVRDTGVEAPVVRRKTRDVFDPNTGEIHPWERTSNDE